MAELHFALARQLGMSPRSLLEDGEPKFLWTDETKFKNLGATTPHEAAVLASFSISVGRCAFGATPDAKVFPVPSSASELRASMLSRWETIGLRELLIVCWSYAIPVLQLNVFPLQQKRMHAVTARLGDRHAVLVGRESRFQAQVAFWVAHELGHIAGGDVEDAAALMDVEDPLRTGDKDTEELAADAFALELLTGHAAPIIEPSSSRYSATELANAVRKAASDARADPGVLALCLGHSEETWEQVFGALKVLGETDVAAVINEVARSQMDLSALTLDSRGFLETIMGERDG